MTRGIVVSQQPAPGPNPGQFIYLREAGSSIQRTVHRSRMTWPTETSRSWSLRENDADLTMSALHDILGLVPGVKPGRSGLGKAAYRPEGGRWPFCALPKLKHSQEWFVRKNPVIPSSLLGICLAALLTLGLGWG